MMTVNKHFYQDWDLVFFLKSGVFILATSGSLIWFLLGIKIIAFVFFIPAIIILTLYSFSRPYILLFALLLFLLITSVFSNYVQGIFGLLTKELLLFLIILGWFSNSLISGKLFINKRCVKSRDIILLIFVMYLIAEMFRQPGNVGFFGLRSIALYSPLSLLIPCIITNTNRLEKLIKVFMVGALFVSLVSIIQQIFVDSFMTMLGYKAGDVSFRTTAGILKASSTVGSAGEAGSLLTIFFFFFLIVWANDEKYFNTKIGIIKIMVLLILGLGIICTFSRIVWLGAIICFFIFIFYYRNRAKAFLIIALPILIIVNLYFHNFLAEQFISSFGYGDNTQSVASAIARIEIIQNTLKLFIYDQPILGYGLGITGAPSLKNAALLRHGYQVMDNYYLKLTVETGLIGLILFCTFLFLSIKESFYLFKCSRDRKIAAVSLSIGMGLIVYAVISSASSLLESPVMNIYFWTLIGLLTVCENIKHNSSILN